MIFVQAYYASADFGVALILVGAALSALQFD
jgi:hypothetical protein